MIKSLYTSLIVRLLTLITSSVIIIMQNCIITQLVILCLLVTIAHTLLKRIRLFHMYLTYVTIFTMFFFITSISIQWIIQGSPYMLSSILRMMKMYNLSLIAFLIFARLRLNISMIKSPIGRIFFYVLITSKLMLHIRLLVNDSYHVVRINYGFRGIKGLFKLLHYSIRVISINALIKCMEYYESLVLRLLRGIVNTSHS